MKSPHLQVLALALEGKLVGILAMESESRIIARQPLICLRATSMDNTQYFYRTNIFSLKDNNVALADIHQPEKLTPLDGWLGLVVSHADGHHTIHQLIDFLGRQYPSAPPNLEETIHSVIERLEAAKIIQLSTRVTSLPYYLASPIEVLDLEKARKLIEKDGYCAVNELH